MILYGTEMGVDLKFKSVYILWQQLSAVLLLEKISKEQRYNLETNKYLWGFAYTIVIDIGCLFGVIYNPMKNKRIT
jgi:hypothetical protein